MPELAGRLAVGTGRGSGGLTVGPSILSRKLSGIPAGVSGTTYSISMPVSMQQLASRHSAPDVGQTRQHVGL